jgi:hypothetical protein
MQRAQPSFFHRLFDRVNIGIRCAFEPRGVHAQHHLDAMSVLLRDPKALVRSHAKQYRFRYYF